MVSSPSARMAAANRPAFVAPAVPSAKVPTGVPAGICTMESKLSLPSRSAVFIGTPRTGREVSAAAAPGNTAALLAPAMMTFRPRSRAVETYSSKRAGVWCAEITRASLAMPSSSRISADFYIVGQSASLSIMIPTNGIPDMSSSLHASPLWRIPVALGFVAMVSTSSRLERLQVGFCNLAECLRENCAAAGYPRIWK